MDPLTGTLIVAGTTAAAQLLSGLLGAKANRESEQRASETAAAGNVLQMQQNLFGQQQKQTENALGDLIASYRRSIGG